MLLRPGDPPSIIGRDILQHLDLTCDVMNGRLELELAQV